MVKLSKSFLIAVKLNELPAYQIAQLADVNPSFLSKVMAGIEPARRGDPRLARLAEALGMEEADIFEEVTNDQTGH